MWHARVENYWQAREDIVADYPGKRLNMPSASQMKYWDFMSDHMKETCPKGTPTTQMLSGLAVASKAYKEKLREAADGAESA